MIPRLPKGFSYPMEIGGGAFATVYRVRQVSLDRWVALKIVREKDPLRRRAILREARTQAQLHVDAIPQVYDTFEWQGTICIVMQWIKGVSLKTLLSRHLSHTHRLWLADGFLAALAALHARGFAHRDLKPENVLVSPTDGVFLVDFGFTKNINDGEVSMAGYIKGTPAYMAPEMWSGGSQTDYLRADVYAAGKICTELLPHKHQLSFETDRLTAYLPRHRPADAMEVYREWERFLGGRPPIAQWQEVVGSTCSAQLAQRLYAAARELLYAGREEGAYWLLVECLQENPNHAEAVSLMESFPRRSRARVRNKRIVFSVSTALGCLVVLFAFLAGRKSTQPSPARHAQVFHDSYAQRMTGHRTAVRGDRASTAVFRRMGSGATALSGMLYVSSLPPHGSLYVDETAYGRDSSLLKGIRVAYGAHTLRWRDPQQRTLWKEHIHLLPFEVQGVHIHRVTP
jgi:serine/threonine protein kinase